MTSGIQDCREPCRVLVLDRSPLFAEALSCLLTTAGLQAAPDTGELDVVDVVLVDGEFTTDVLAQLTAGLRTRFPRAHVLLLFHEARPGNEMLAGQLSAAGWLTRAAGPTGLVEAVLSVAAGRPVRAPRVISLVDAEMSLCAERLTAREVGVLRLLAMGRTNSDIAVELDISPNTVRTHVQNILGKLGVANRLAAVTTARRAGLLDNRVPAALSSVGS